MSHLIGLMGRKRSGKDTFAARLVETHGFVRLAFADTLKDAALDVNPLLSSFGLRLRDLVEERGWEVAKENREVRRFLQEFGVSIRENLDKDAWINPVRRITQHLLDTGISVVITDVRFHNEAEMIMSLDGTLINVMRPDAPNDDTHVSETGIPFELADYNVGNFGTVDDLHRTVDAMRNFLAPVLL